MAFFEWSEKLETGVHDIDFQHRNLVAMVNSLAEAVEEPDLDARILIARITLEQLINYTNYHFQTEEGFMSEAQFEHLSEHQKAHEALKTVALDLNERFNNGENVIPNLLTFLRSWLENHIMGMDMQYAPALRAAGTKQF